MPGSAPPPPARADEGGSALLVRFGTAVGLAAVAALACVVPAALRVASSDAGDVGRTHAWIGLAAAALLPMLAAVVVLRGAREGLRAFAGAGAGLRLYVMTLWMAVLLVGLSLFGSVLRATTHHHGLAGVTFAFGALAFAVGDALVCVRVFNIARMMPEGGRRVLLVALGAAVGIVLLAVGVRFVRAASHDEVSYAAAGTVVDVLAFALAALFASRRSLVSRRSIALVGPPIAVVVAAVGVAMLREAPLRAAIGERAPAFGAIVEALVPR
ncbi:MAG TPA: hypothetical protein VMI75_17365 [Polyangiaceae bacterium]|nr:hypothetical protein [Polyangiaceae bacterium]